MFVFMTLLAVVFVLLMYYFASNFGEQEKRKVQEQALALQKNVERLEYKKSEILAKEKNLSQKASDLFMLYDITREISKKFYEREAFEVFRHALKEKVRFEDCRLINVEGDRRKQIPEGSEYVIFSIKARQKKLGHIAIKGLHAQDEDKFVILAQQFALALQRVKLYEEVEKSATTDSLTGIHTRRYLLERLEEEIARARDKEISLSFLMIDVDHFKSFNDKYGHLVGDQILKAIGTLIQENIREIDYAGRYGGEEFSVVLPDTDTEGGFFVAQRIRKAIEEATIRAYDAIVKVTVSLGISSFPKDGKNCTELIDKADWALYRSKKRGRNCVTIFGVYKK